jgi:hypothetical protein
MGGKRRRGKRKAPLSGTKPAGGAGSSSRSQRSWLHWRPGLWLTTVSTVVAVATGMFTLRDQIFPSDSSTASASPAAFEGSVADICTALNAAEAARPRQTRALMAKLRAARTPTDERNDLLNSWDVSLDVQQTQLAALEGLEAPDGVRHVFQTTKTVWDADLTRIRGFAQRLDSASSSRQLLAAIDTLPAVEGAIGAGKVTTDAGLTRLGGGRCTLQQPADVPVVTLPASVKLSPAVNPPATRPKPSEPVTHRQGSGVRSTQPIPASYGHLGLTGSRVTPFTPDVAPSPPAITPQVQPPASTAVPAGHATRTVGGG